MVKNTPRRNRAMTLVEIIVTSIMMAIVFTGAMSTMAITMKRITSSVQAENEEKQMDRMQAEMSYFIKRAASLSILDDSGEIADSGNVLQCTLQDDSLEETSIKTVKFSLSPSGDGYHKTLAIQITLDSGASKTYTYTQELRTPDSEDMFARESNGFIKYRWELDSGYGTESFNNMAVPSAGL